MQKVSRSARAQKQEDLLQKLIDLNSHIGLELQNSTYFEEFNKILSFANYSQSAVPVTSREKSGKEKCSFAGARCPMENIEHNLVREYLRDTDVVLELGARFGTTSCAIAAKQRNSGKLVSVEPDSTVWNLLAFNRQIHTCNFWTYRGVISNQSAVVAPASYATRAVASKPSTATPPTTIDTITPTSPTTPSNHFMTYEKIQQETKLQFTALLIDCEGCINHLFRGYDSSPTLLATTLQSVEVIILEGDMAMRTPTCKQDCVDYAVWIEIFHSMGFRIIHQQSDPEFPFIFHYVFQRRR